VVRGSIKIGSYTSRSRAQGPPSAAWEDIIDLEVSSSTVGDWTVLKLDGEVDIYTAGTLRDAVNGAVEEGRYRIAVDLADMEFMDSSGLGVLIAALKRLKENGGELLLVSPRDQMRRILKLTGLDKILTIRDALGEATV
jgi:anti-sigma B factor antagonist